MESLSSLTLCCNPEPTGGWQVPEFFSLSTGLWTGRRIQVKRWLNPYWATFLLTICRSFPVNIRFIHEIIKEEWVTHGLLERLPRRHRNSWTSSPLLEYHTGIHPSLGLNTRFKRQCPRDSPWDSCSKFLKDEPEIPKAENSNDRISGNSCVIILWKSF